MGTHPIFESDFDCLTEHRTVENVESRRGPALWRFQPPAQRGEGQAELRKLAAFAQRMGQAQCAHQSLHSLPARLQSSQARHQRLRRVRRKEEEEEKKEE